MEITKNRIVITIKMRSLILDLHVPADGVSQWVSSVADFVLLSVDYFACKDDVKNSLARAKPEVAQT